MSADLSNNVFPNKPPVATVASADHDALPAGTRFGEFEILRVLGVGGFGIVYLAQDHSLERQVALKEYMPSTLATRGIAPLVTIRSSAHAETYALGLRSFVNEARLLARFDHPSLVKVYRFWEDNGTAYMVMPYLHGKTLRDVRRAMTEPPTEAWLRGVLDPMLDALDQLHREGVFHRDIAPDNILLPEAAPPILLDFGAARRVISDRTQSLTAILKPSYAPIEQYAEMTQLRQGPWTDLYALGAVLHFLVFGVPPSPSTARAVQPDAELIEQRVVPGVSPRFMSAIAWMLGVRPLERPQNVASLRAGLNGEIPIPSSVRRETTAAMGGAAMAAANAVESCVAYQPTQVFASTAVDVPIALQDAPIAGVEPKPPRVADPRDSASTLPGAGPTTVPEDSPATVPFESQRMPRGPSSPGAARASSGRRTGVLAVAGIAAAAIAAAVIWKFVGVIGDRVAPAPFAQAASAAASGVSGDSAKAADAPVSTAASRAAEVTAIGSAAVASSAAVSNAAVSNVAPASAPDASPLAGTSASVGSGASAELPIASVANVAAPSTQPVNKSAAVDDAANKSAPVSAAAAVRPKTRSSFAKPGDGIGQPVPEIGNEVPRTGVADALPQRGRPVPTRDSRPMQTAQAVPVVAGEPATAREACGRRVFIAMALCMERECQRPKFGGEAECTRILEEQRRRADR